MSHVKDGWPPGPWDEEPDRHYWENNGLVCLAVRSEGMGNWCGYVAVPAEHPYYGMDYHTVNLKLANPPHRGLTYSSKCHGEVCHAPQGWEPDDVWWLGFDCAHVGDTTPSMKHYELYGVYRSLEYLCGEINKLATELTTNPEFERVY